MTNTERGRVLERFARRFLESQNYSVVEEVRLTGMEVDLLAEELTTGEVVLVECKAQRSTISADTISKLLGNVSIRNATGGWLLTTHALSKDAKGIQAEWETRPPSVRRTLQIFEPNMLVRRLAAANIIVPPETLQHNTEARHAKEAYLLLTQFGEFWAIPILERVTGIRHSALLFDAITGAPIECSEILTSIAKTDTSLANLNWLAATSTNETGDTQIRRELQSVVRVPVADNWADYRPARPSDFIGRRAFLQNVFDLFDRVRSGETQTRIFAIKAPSGWGKTKIVCSLSVTKPARPLERLLLGKSRPLDS